jgi:hypothetical protein
MVKTGITIIFRTTGRAHPKGSAEAQAVEDELCPVMRKALEDHFKDNPDFELTDCGCIFL